MDDSGRLDSSNAILLRVSQRGTLANVAQKQGRLNAKACERAYPQAAHCGTHLNGSVSSQKRQFAAYSAGAGMTSVTRGCVRRQDDLHTRARDVQGYQDTPCCAR